MDSPSISSVIYFSNLHLPSLEILELTCVFHLYIGLPPPPLLFSIFVVGNSAVYFFGYLSSFIRSIRPYRLSVPCSKFLITDEITSLQFPCKNFVCISFLPYACYITRSAIWNTLQRATFLLWGSLYGCRHRYRSGINNSSVFLFHILLSFMSMFFLCANKCFIHSLLLLFYYFHHSCFLFCVSNFIHVWCSEHYFGSREQVVNKSKGT